MSAPLYVDIQSDVWTFTLNRADKRNAFSAQLVDQLLAAVIRAHVEGARVLVFRGEGKNFSAGFDFDGFNQQSEGDLLLRFVRIEMLLQAVASSPCLTLALAHGKNFGAGVDLFSTCRHRVATNDATFRMPGLKFGLVLGTRRFGDMVGSAQAARVLETSMMFNTEQAVAMGFVQRVLPMEHWDEAIAEAQRTATALDDTSRAALYRALATDQADTDLATLVRSAAQPGLKERMGRYLAG
jgi:enoyl-CoA hydratase